jgi:hypothetical protein
LKERWEISGNFDAADVFFKILATVYFFAHPEFSVIYKGPGPGTACNIKINGTNDED